MFVEFKSILLATCAFFAVASKANRVPLVVHGSKIEPLNQKSSSGSSFDSSSLSSSEELRDLQLDQIARLINSHNHAVQESFAVKSDELIKLLGKAEDTVTVQATLVAFGASSNEALARRIDVLKVAILEVWNSKKVPASSQRKTDSTFQKHLTKNTLAEMDKKAKEEKRRAREEKRQARKRNIGRRPSMKEQWTVSCPKSK